MRFKNNILPVLIASAILGSTGIVFANTTTGTDTKTEESELKSHFSTVRGNVLKVTSSNDNEKGNEIFVLISDKVGNKTTMVVNENTHIYEGKDRKIEVGQIITAYYDNTLPAPLIFPPQYLAQVVIMENTEIKNNIKIDYFDNELISADKTLKLNIDESVNIVDHTNTKYTGELKNKNLLIDYDVSTKSIPAQTTPKKVVVLKNVIEENKEELRYSSVEGTITEVTKKLNKNTAYLIQFGEDAKEYLVIDNNTVFLNGKDFKVGDKVIGVYDSLTPALAIYPPQTTVVAIGLQGKDNFIKLSKFDENLVSSDNNLKLNISDKTEVLSLDGKKYTGELKDKQLIVVYDVTTRSIPAQTTPSKVYVLEEKDSEVTEKPEVNDMKDLIVNEKSLGENAILKENNIAMVPLREVLDALKLDIAWDNNTKSIKLAGNVSLKVGDTNYYKGDQATELESAPIIKDDKTYVPLSFFEKILSVNITYSNGNVKLNNK